MPPKPRDVRRAVTYFPTAMFDKLQERADRNFNSISRELLHIAAKVLQEEAQKQEQTKEAVAQ